MSLSLIQIFLKNLTVIQLLDNAIHFYIRILEEQL